MLGKKRAAQHPTNQGGTQLLFNCLRPRSTRILCYFVFAAAIDFALAPENDQLIEKLVAEDNANARVIEVNSGETTFSQKFMETT